MNRKLTNAHIAAFAIYFICACDFSLKFPLAMTLKAENLRTNSVSQCFITLARDPSQGGRIMLVCCERICRICWMSLFHLYISFFLSCFYYPIVFRLLNSSINQIRECKIRKSLFCWTTFLTVCVTVTEIWVGIALLYEWKVKRSPTSLICESNTELSSVNNLLQLL